MARLIIYYAHPGHRFSRVNREMANAASAVDGIEFVDLYAAYPRHNIDVDIEQERLRTHDIIVFQCPIFWYSTPSLVKEWIDLVLEHGFAYGEGGDALAGKSLMFALTAGGPEDAYSGDGYQRFPLRTFLTPLEQTARLCQMRFPAPYVLHSSLHAEAHGTYRPHIDGYLELIRALRDDTYDIDRAESMDIVTAGTLPLKRKESAHG